MTESVYRLAPVRTFTVNERSVLVCFEAHDTRRIVATEEAMLLAACQEFRTLDDHARHIEQTLARPPIDALRARLAEFVRARWLLPVADFLTHGPLSSPRGPTDELSWLVVPTRDRVPSLLRALDSYVQNARAYGRAVRILVSDTADRRRGEACRQALRQFAADAHVRVSYDGPEEKSLFADLLARRGHLPKEIVEFAVLGTGWAGEAIGANRNAALLRTAGERILSIDDDTVCTPFGAPNDVGQVLSLGGDVDAAEVWSYPSRLAALADVTPKDIDAIGTHAACLGRPLPILVRDRQVATGSIVFQQTCSHMLKSLLLGTGTIVATMNGVVGDSGMYSGELLALHESPSTRQRLLRSEAAYRQVTSSREIVRQAPSESVSHGGHFMSTCVGLDNREVLPPFLSVYRSEDRLFGATVMACYDAAFYVHLPWSILHAPDGSRGYAPDPWSRVRVADVLLALMASWCTTARPQSAVDRLRALGEEFEDIAHLAPGDLREILTKALEARLFEAIRHKEGLLRRYDSEPAYWANELRRQMHLSIESLADERYILPIELRERFGDAEAPARLRSLLGEFGRLLQWWPSIVETARALRSRDGDVAVA